MIHVSLSKRPTELESVSVYSSLFAMVGKFNIKYLKLVYAVIRRSTGLCHPFEGQDNLVSASCKCRCIIAY